MIHRAGVPGGAVYCGTVGAWDVGWGWRDQPQLQSHLLIRQPTNSTLQRVQLRTLHYENKAQTLNSTRPGEVTDQVTIPHVTFLYRGGGTEAIAFLGWF